MLPYAAAADRVVEAFESDVATGLTPDVAAARLLEVGPNRLTETGTSSWVRLLFEQINNVLVWVLLAAAAISGLVLQEWIDTVVILAIVVLNAVLGFSQESRAEKALQALAALRAPHATVLRGGALHRVDVAVIVPGDILILDAGDRIPADARLVEAVHLRLDESALTGESLPVEKSLDALEPDLGTADRCNMVFAGTAVVAGRGRAVVTATAADTAFGQIAELLDTDDPPTPLEAELDRVGKVIAIAALVVAAVIFALGVSRNIGAETMFLTAVALAVAAIPEGLSAVVTVTLSRGVSAMAQHNAIVRRLPAVEALGATDVICTDKTGTLTENYIRVQELEFAGLHITSVGDQSDGRILRYAQIAALCNDAGRAELGAAPQGFVGDPTEVALLESVDPVIVSVDRLRTQYPRLDEVAFDSSRKRMATLHADGDRAILLVKGAPEEVLVRCATYEDHDGPRAFDADRRQSGADAAAAMARRGLRTLAFAYRFVDAPTGVGPLQELEADLTLVAVVGMSDQIRREARDAVSAARRAGIDVVMVTGDHQVTAAAVGRQLGILGDGHLVVGGATLRSMDPDELAANIESYRVFARVDPADKVAIVRAWQGRGAIVAMTGDGVNDAPALRTADVGIAMGSGTGVAREAADMVLADDNFATIVAAVSHGRAIFSNLQKVVYFLLASNSAEVLVMLFGFILFGSHGEPLLATQLLWINLVTDGLPALALGVDSANPDLMARPPTHGHRFLGRRRQIRLAGQGTLLALGATSVFAYGFWVRDLHFEEARTLLFTALVIVQIVHAYNVRAEDSTLWRSGTGPNWLLAGATAASCALQIAVVYTAVGQRLFDTTPIAAIDWVAIVVAVAVTFAAVRVFSRRVAA